MELTLLILTPLLGKLAQKIVDGLKYLTAFAESHRYVKQITAFVVSVAVTYAGLEGTDRLVNDFAVDDVTSALVAVATFALSMIFHNSKKLSAGYGVRR